MDAALRTALDEVARAERLDLDVGPSPAPVLGPRLRDAGAEGLDALERIVREGSPTGRVWAVSLLNGLDAARARPHLERMLADATPIVVNTCTLGYRRTCHWAAAQLGVPAPRVPDPSERRALWTAIGFVVAFVLAAALLSFALR